MIAVVRQMKMKKEYIAVYFGLAAFLLTFLLSNFLYAKGLKHEGIVAIDCCLLILGLTMLIGLYSNVKNYGFFYAGVRNQDANLSTRQLDAKGYKRTKKGTRGYRLGIACATGMSGLVLVFGGIRLLKDIGILSKCKPNQRLLPTARIGQ